MVKTFKKNPEEKSHRHSLDIYLIIFGLNSVAVE